MRTFLVMLMMTFMITLPIAEQVEAKRLGGGFSLGKSFSSPKKAAAPKQQNKAAPNQTKQAAGAPQQRSGFGGLMAGVLAGGIFGALLFGGAFEGLQFMDLLLIAGLIFLVYKIMSSKKRSETAYATARAEQSAQQYEINPHNQQRSAKTEATGSEFKPTPAFNSGWGESQLIELPEWFNEKAFLEGSREHFITLQKAWDECDWESIASYTSAELFSVLQQERAKLPEDQVTEVVSVMPELLNFTDNGEHVIVSINFYGWLKENSQETTEFNEVWHLSRDMSKDNADWFIVGIQQN